MGVEIPLLFTQYKCIFCLCREDNFFKLRGIDFFIQPWYRWRRSYYIFMSGHSKWKQIKQHKGAADIKKAMVFTKIANALTLAARHGGGDPEFNFKLRLSVDKAKECNMPKENIERAIKRGTGALEGVQIEEITYEVFGPGKIPVIIETLTDNKNRTVSDLKHLLNETGGSLATPNSVMWMFEKCGVLRLDSKNWTPEQRNSFELRAIDAGANDIFDELEEIVVCTPISVLQTAKESLEANGYKIESAEIEFVAKERKNIMNHELKEKIEQFFEQLDAMEDVNAYYTTL